MLIFIGPRRQTYLLRTMKRDDRMPAWTCRTYQWLFRTRSLPAATYIFVGVDRLDHGERRLGGQFYRHINGLGEGFQALNDPAVAMGRYRLLRTLHERGINDFNAYLVAEGAQPQRYPVFIRRDSSSTLPLTGLIETPQHLAQEIDRLVGAGEVPEDLIIIEYCTEPVRPGLFRKLGMWRSGQVYAPRVTLYGGNWFVKNSSQAEATDADHADDADILATNRFEPILREVFETAHIEYGRADFSLVAGRPQIYEINFNPDLRVQDANKPHPHGQRWANLIRTDDLGFAAMRTLDRPGSGAKKTISNDELNAFRLRFWRNYAPQRY